MKNALKLQRLNINVTKNVMFLGAISTVMAALILKGQLHHNTGGWEGNETWLKMDKFPFVVLSKVIMNSSQNFMYWKNRTDVEYELNEKARSTTLGSLDLISIWKNFKPTDKYSPLCVELLAFYPSRVDYLTGLFEPRDM